MESKKVIDAIKKILTDLSKLDDDLLAQVIDGTVKFKCEFPKAKSVGNADKKSGPSDVSSLPFEEYKTALCSCTSRAEATEYLTGLKLKVAELKQFAKYLDLKDVPPSGKAAILKAIVDQTIGFRLDSKAVFKT
jgi:hypothetical protein